LRAALHRHSYNTRRVILNVQQQMMEDNYKEFLARKVVTSAQPVGPAWSLSRCEAHH
jgi:hypothetical protein